MKSKITAREFYYKYCVIKTNNDIIKPTYRESDIYLFNIMDEARINNFKLIKSKRRDDYE